MIKIDPIIAVKNVKESAEFYQKIFGLKRTHGGDNFAVLVSDEQEIILCLHKWEEDNHPTLTNAALPNGNGLLLYLKTDNLHLIIQNVMKHNVKIEEEIHENPNSLKQEFSIRDVDNYFITITEYHEYEG